MASSFILLLVGYSGIKLIFDAGVPPNSNSATISFFTSCVLILCGFMTGAGGNAGLTGAVNSTAKTFPDKARATTTGLVISGFGLSAFLFSTISRIHFAGNTSSFLGLLALGTSLPMIAGFFFVRPIPLPSSDTSDSSSEDEEEGTRNGIEIRRSREERDQDEDPERVDDSGHERDGEQSALLPLVAHDQLQQGLETPTKRAVLPQGQGQLVPNVNIYGRELWTSTDFLLLFAILSIYINNAGLMSQALYIYSLSPRSQSPGQGGVPVYDPIAAAHWQADQVASISLLNFAGRIFIGVFSLLSSSSLPSRIALTPPSGITTDTLKHHLSLPRSSALLLVAALFVLSQVLAALVVDDVKHLWIASATLGLAHGSVFSLFPNVCLEWFGMAHFSENWGYLSIAPIVFGNIFAVVFGRNLDAHSSPSSPALLYSGISLPSYSGATSMRTPPLPLPPLPHHPPPPSPSLRPLPPLLPPLPLRPPRPPSPLPLTTPPLPPSSQILVQNHPQQPHLHQYRLQHVPSAANATPTLCTSRSSRVSSRPC
ncbi:hypothetical protein C0995_013971 [Termitomyces sp. Mi166|nr:hypothetical protein C0995_013971 [Termitomyces sp. Mi166\